MGPAALRPTLGSLGARLPTVMQGVILQEGPQQACFHQGAHLSSPLGGKPRGWCPNSLLKGASKGWSRSGPFSSLPSVDSREPFPRPHFTALDESTVCGLSGRQRKCWKILSHLSAHLLLQALGVVTQGQTFMGLEATYLLEASGAVWALRGGPAWPGLQVLRYSEEHRLRISLSGGKRQNSEAGFPSPQNLLGSSDCLSSVHKYPFPLHALAKPLQAWESPEVEWTCPCRTGLPFMVILYSLPHHPQLSHPGKHSPPEADGLRRQRGSKALALSHRMVLREPANNLSLKTPVKLSPNQVHPGW